SILGAASTALDCFATPGKFGFISAATVLALGTSSRSNPSCFDPSSTIKLTTPVALPLVGSSWRQGLAGPGRNPFRRRSECSRSPALPQPPPACWSRQSRSLGAGPDQPPAPAGGHIGLLPSDTRSSRSDPRRSRLPSGLVGTRT